MKLYIRHAVILLLPALIAGCRSSGDQSGNGELMGMREQRSLLVKSRPLQEFGLTPSFPFGNDVLYLGGTLLEPGQTATLRFTPGGMPIIGLQGRSGRKTMSALLDTASNVSWMQYSSAEKNDLAFLSSNSGPIPYRGTAVSEGVDAYAAVIPLLHLDQLTLNKTPFYIRMARGTMQPMIYSSMPPRVDAVLGYDNLRQFAYLQFDLREGVVRFSTSDLYVPDEDRLMDKVAISQVCRDCLAVEGAVQGETVPIVLDFAGDFAFARGDTREPQTSQVALGDVVFLNVKNEVLASQDKYPRAGRRMLEKYVVTVCPREGVVCFERPR